VSSRQGQGGARALPPAADAGATEKAPVVLELPADFTFTGASSPGPVVFSHVSHVDLQRPNCSACHADQFRLTEPARAVTGFVTGERLHQELCGTCHDGKTAFGIEEACDICHRP
jgi:c(7)-type cytochrome triheme protein